jgi:hypothetical protein
MLTRTAAQTFITLLALNACSGRYVVGTEDTTDSDAGGESTSAGTTASPKGGGGRANSPAHFGGTSGSPPAAAGGATSPAAGGSPPSPAGGMPGSGTSACDWPALLIPEPDPTPAPGLVVWRRLTRFLLDQTPIPDENLPSPVTVEWVQATAMRLLDENPNAPVFRLLLENSNLNSSTSALYGERLLEPGATLRDLIASTDSSEPERIGFLTDPDFLRQYYTISGRGTYIVNALFCASVPPEPPGTPDIPDRSGMTRRMQLEQELNEPGCVGCHRYIDPLGYALENFDALGAYRTIDDGFPVDASGSSRTVGGAQLDFSGIHDLAPQLAESCEVARCITQRLLIDALTRASTLESAPIVPDEASINAIARNFLQTDGTLRALVREVVTSRLFLE